MAYHAPEPGWAGYPIHHMYLLAVLFAAVTLAAHVQYNLGIRTDAGEVLEWGVLSLDEKRPALVEFSPSSVASPPASGCLGTQTIDGFQCQTVFADIDPDTVKGTLAYISAQGKLTQAQLVPGPRSQLDVEVPRFAPAAQLKRPEPPKAQRGGSRAYRQDEDASEEEVDKSLLEKYWKYLLPLAIVFAVNVFGPRPPPRE